MGAGGRIVREREREREKKKRRERESKRERWISKFQYKDL